jgi:hypothetical protein
MKLPMLILLAALLCGCQKQAPKPLPPVQTASGAIDIERLKLWAEEMSGTDVFNAWLSAVEPASNRVQIVTRYATAADEAIVRYLASQSRGSLVAKLDSLARKTNRHHYTKDQLERAIALKDEAAAKRKSKRPPSE